MRGCGCDLLPFQLCSCDVLMRCAQLQSPSACICWAQIARPLWEYGIRKEIERGNTVLVVAHTNTLRGLMTVIDGERLLRSAR